MASGPRLHYSLGRAPFPALTVTSELLQSMMLWLLWQHGALGAGQGDGVVAPYSAPSRQGRACSVFSFPLIEKSRLCFEG